MANAEVSGLRCPGHGQHVGGVVGGENHPVRCFGQQGPKPPGTARQVQDEAGIVGQSQRMARNLLVTPVRKAARPSLVVLFQVLLRMAAVVFAREFQFDRRCLGHCVATQSEDVRNSN